MIKGEDVVDENDGRYKKYLLDVFANFVRPLKDKSVETFEKYVFN